MTVFFKRQLQIFLMFVLVSVNLYVLSMVILYYSVSNTIEDFKKQYIEQDAEQPYVTQRAKMREQSSSKPNMAEKGSHQYWLEQQQRYQPKTDNRSYEMRQLDLQQKANLYKQLLK